MEEHKVVPKEKRWPEQKGYNPPLYISFDRLEPAPKIEVDKSKCTTPLSCKKCILACPQAVFYVQATEAKRGREQDPAVPGEYRLWACWRYACTGCGDCLKACPMDAIKIESSSGWGIYPKNIKARK